MTRKKIPAGDRVCASATVAFLNRRTFARQVLALGYVLSAPGCSVRVLSQAGEKYGPPPITGLHQIAVSPDGEVVAASYTDPQSSSTRVALYAWRTEKVTRLDVSSGFVAEESTDLSSVSGKPRPTSSILSAGYPAFSSDGQTLAITRHTGWSANWDVALVDLRTRAVKSITRRLGLQTASSPRFAPTRHQIAFSGGAGRFTGHRRGEIIRLADLGGNEIRDLTDPEKGFYQVSDICWLAPDTLLFQARSPEDEALAAQVLAMGRAVVDLLQYQVRLPTTFGPTFAVPKLLTP